MIVGGANRRTDLGLLPTHLVAVDDDQLATMMGQTGVTLGNEKLRVVRGTFHKPYPTRKFPFVHTVRALPTSRLGTASSLYPAGRIAKYVAPLIGDVCSIQLGDSQLSDGCSWAKTAQPFLATFSAGRQSKLTVLRLSKSHLGLGRSSHTRRSELVNLLASSLTCRRYFVTTSDHESR